MFCFVQKELGFWNALAVEIGFLHNANLLVYAYHVVGAFYATFHSHRRITSAIFAILGTVVYLRRTTSKPFFTPLLVLIALAAQALFWMFHYGFVLLSPFVPSLPRNIANSLGIVLVVLGPVASLFSLSGLLQAASLCVSILFYLSWILDGSISMFPEQVVFAAWTFPMLPVLLAGNIYASWKRPHLFISGTPVAWLLVSLLCIRWIIMSRLSITKRCGRVGSFHTEKNVLHVLRYAFFGWILMDANPLSFNIPENLVCFSAMDMILEVLALLFDRLMTSNKNE